MPSSDFALTWLRWMAQKPDIGPHALTLSAPRSTVVWYRRITCCVVSKAWWRPNARNADVLNATLLLLRGAGVVQWQSLPGPDTICCCGRTPSTQPPADGRMRLFWGDTSAQREGAHLSIPALIPPLSGPRRVPLCRSLSTSTPPSALPGWLVWGLVEPGALHMALQQNEPIDEATDWLWVYLMVIPLPSLLLLLPAGPPTPSLFQPTTDNPCVSIFLIQIVGV